MGREYRDLINPATEKVYGKLVLGNQSDVDAAVKAARSAFETFSRSSISDRIALITAIIRSYSARMDEIGESICEGLGAPVKFAKRFQAGAGLAHFKQIIKVLENYNFQQDFNQTRIIKEPIGVCGLIVPWNWPMNQITCKIAPAIAAGCTMVLKPSELIPEPAIILMEILEDVGVPPGVVNMVQGDGPVVGAAIASHPEVDMISFTGSTQGGIAVAELAAKSVKRVSQELGGKAANILLDDVDFETAVDRGIRLCFRNSGQSCNSPSRMLVPKKRLDQVISFAKTSVNLIKVGYPIDDGVDLGPVVSCKQWESIQSFINIGIREGATLIAGGPNRPDGFDSGYFVKPTIFSGVTSDMTISKEEIFGPVLCIMTYENEDHAIQIANETPFGLAAYVESSDLSRARSVAGRIRAGMVHLNGAVADPGAPFGGYRMSGNGREWGAYGLEEFLEKKAVMGYSTKENRE